jgi:peptidoglycan/LPS O-acetylase OafA/YrhL
MASKALMTLPRTTDPKSDRRKSRFALLDGLRGAAAIAVMVFHYEQAQPTSWFTASHGFLAVDFFFLLSGFVICHAYEAKLERGLPFRRFFLMRVIRLYPLLIIGVLTSFVMRALLEHAHGHPALDRGQWPTLFLSLLGLPDFSQPPGSEFLLLPPRWSLFYELAVNLAYAACINFLSNRIVVLLIAVSGAALLWFACQFGVDHLTMPVCTARTTFSFLFGVLICRLQRTGKLPAVSVPAWLIAIVIALALSVPKWPTWNLPLSIVCIYIIFPFSVIATCQRPISGIQARISEILGDLSYPLYVLHYPAVFLFAFIYARMNLPDAVQVLLSVTILLGACAVILRLYDEPVREFLSRRLLLRAAAEPLETAP